jgi:tetratricopeptide (TPR) repeat protein
VDGAGWTNVTTALAGDGTRVEARYAPNRLLPKFATLVSNEAMEALAFRLLHHFLRHCGASLDAAASRYVLESVLQWFGNAENGDHLEEFLDLTVVRMDLLASVEKKRDCVVLPRVGEALEALGRFPLAARVYRHAADHYPAGPEGGEMRWRVYEYAGIAYRRHDRLELAEDMYARALHLYERGGNPFDFGDENFEKLCHNIKIMYGPLGVRSVENKKVTVTFDFLLAAAGYFEAVGHPFWAPSTDYVLKPEFRLRSGALRALRSAARAAATAAEFRAGVLGCAKRGVNWSAFAVAGVPGRSEESLVRECSLDVLSRGNASKSLVRCFNPACAKLEENNEGGKFMQCPCRTTYYCSKACQVSSPSKQSVFSSSLSPVASDNLTVAQHACLP